MEGISPLWDQMPLRPFRAVEAPAEEPPRTIIATPFGDVFRTAIETVTGPDADPITDMFRASVQAVRETDAQKVQLEYLTATGQLDNPALLSIASSKAQLSVNLLVELRNRAVEAYNELMRISL